MNNGIISNEIFRKLLESTPETIFHATADKIYYKRGYEYFKQCRLAKFHWNQDYSRLMAWVDGSELYELEFYLSRSNLKATCSCPLYDDVGDCKHIVCALLMVHYLLTAKLNDHYFITLQEQLLDKSVTHIIPKNVEVHMYNENYGLTLRIEHGDLNRDHKLYEIVRALNFVTDARMEKKYITTLMNQSTTIPFIAHLPQGQTQVGFDPKHILKQVAKLSVQDDKVEVQILGIVKDKYKENFTTFFRNNFFIDWDEAKVGVIKGKKLALERQKDSYIHYNDDKLIPTSIPFYIERSVFNVEKPIIYRYGPDISNFIFSNQDGIQRLHPSYGINISIEDDGYMALITPMSFPIDDHKDTLKCQIAAHLEDLFEATFCKSIKKQKFVQEFLFATAYSHLVNNSKSSEKVMAALDKKIKKMDHWYVDIVKKNVTKFIKNILFDDSIESLIVYNDTFYTISWDFKKFFTGWLLAFGIVEDNCTINLLDGYMAVPLPIMYKKLLKLQSLCKEYGIEVFFQKKKLAPAALTVTLEGKKNDIDWFEIKPEIKINDQELTSDALDNFLLGNGVRADDQYIQVLDENSMQILQMLNRFMKDHKKREESATKEIVHVPRLQILDLLELRRYGVTLKIPPEEQKLLDSLQNFKKIKKVSLPSQFNATLRPYQYDGYSWLSFLYEHKFGACLADDMGLGKTIQTIAFLAGIHEKIINSSFVNKGPHLIIVPPSLLFNWQHELATFYPAIKVQNYNEVRNTQDFDNAHIVLSTYETVRRDIVLLEKIQFDVVVFDEAQSIKNIVAKRTSAMRQLCSNFKLCLTGTPLENSVSEYYSIMDLAVPGLLPELTKAKNFIDDHNLAIITQRTKPFILRRTKNLILKELPPKTEQDIYLPMSDIQRKLYNKVASEIRSTINEAYISKTNAQATIIALTALLRLRQICISSDLINKQNGNKEYDSPKMDYLLEKVKELIAENNAALIFSQFTSCLDLIEQQFLRANIPFVRIDGKTPIAKRKLIVESFQQRQEVPVMLLSLKTGGTGLNLTRARYVFHVDPWWNPAVENQASDRAHRIGQTQNVMITRLLMQHTIEEKMMTLKKKKQELFDAIIGGTNKKGAVMQKSDFDFLLS